MSSTSPGTPSSAPPTVEDDTCICTWIEVEIGEDDDEDLAETSSLNPKYRSSTPTLSTIQRFPSSQTTHPPLSQQSSRPSSRGRGSSTSSHPNSLSSSPARGAPKESTGTSLRRQSFRSSSTPFEQTSPGVPPRKKRTESQLVAITRSGGWFRVSLNSEEGESSASAKGKGKAQEGTTDEGVMGLGRDSTNSCRLLEYRRFGTDGW